MPRFNPKAAIVIAVFGCPHCGAHEPDDIIQWGSVSARWGGTFDESGTWVDDGNGADMEWDSCDLENYFCRQCDKPFMNPAQISFVDGKPTATLGPRIVPEVPT